MVKQAPFVVYGTVTVDSSVYFGAQVWARDLTEGTVPSPVPSSTYIYTNVSGQYLLDLADSTSAYANGDIVRIYCKVGDMLSYSDVTIDLRTGTATADFTFTKKSGLVDGCKASPLTDGTGTLKRELSKGCLDGMQ